MRWIPQLANRITFQITSADPAALFKEIVASDVCLYDVVWEDELTMRACVRKTDYRAVTVVAQRRGAEIRITDHRGIGLFCRRFAGRPVMILLLTVLTVITVLLPNRILFVEVEGNQQIPKQLILEQAAKCGIRFGASRRDVRSEKTKNQLLSAIPELQWAGVNTRGCVAVISVSQKQESVEEGTDDSGISSIVAARDGVIYSCTATKGTLQCQAGQAVTSGQTLISAFTDCGMTVRATRAEGEILAQTNREITVITPAYEVKRGAETGRTTRFSLLVGKKLINFFKDSGILDTTCVKMYEQIYWTLPGGFQLPVAWVRETYVFYEAVTPEHSKTDYSWVEPYAKKHLQQTMCSGRILSCQFQTQLLEDAYILNGEFACIESIAQRRSEESLEQNGKIN